MCSDDDRNQIKSSDEEKTDSIHENIVNSTKLNNVTELASVTSEDANCTPECDTSVDLANETNHNENDVGHSNNHDESANDENSRDLTNNTALDDDDDENSLLSPDRSRKKRRVAPKFNKFNNCVNTLDGWLKKTVNDEELADSVCDQAIKSE